MKPNSEHGAVMVEAAIYFPLVICTVMAMIYLGLFQMQESALSYVMERIALEAAREEAYPGYTVFGMNEGRSVDFSWSGTAPSKSTVESYYAARHETPGALYREVGQIAQLFTGSGQSESYYQNRYAHAAEAVTLIAAGTIGTPEVSIEKGLLSSTVTVTITHHIPVPGVIRYLGIEESAFQIESKTTKNIVNPGEFVRNVDLAVDLTEYLLEKLGLSESVGGFISKTKEIMEKIL